MNISNHKKIIVIISLILLMFSVGCEDGTDNIVLDSVFIGGTQGVFASFEPFGIEEGGVYTIFDSETFPIEIVLQNKGEEDIEKGDVKVLLKGISVSDFDGITNSELSNKETLEKVSEFNPIGGEERIDFTPSKDAQYKLDVIGFTNIDLFASVEYLYKTHVVVPKVCFKEDLRDTTICDVEGSKDFSVSSAPITVTSVTENSAGKGLVALTFTISNVGNGKVTLPGEDFDVRYGKIKYEIDEPEKWDCKASGLENEARLVNGAAEIRCRLKEPLEADTLYTRQVGLTIEYKYQTVISDTIKIKESQE